MPEQALQDRAGDPGLDPCKYLDQDTESRKMVGTAAGIAGLTMASRIMALVRDICMASLLGAGPLADCLYAALRLPHAGRRLLAEGSLGLGLTAGLLAESHACGLASASHKNYLPAAGLVAKPNDPASGLSLASVLAALTLAAGLVLVLPTAFCLLFPELPARLLAPGLGPAMQQDLVSMLRLAIPYLPLAGLAGIAMAALHARGRFFLAACSPCVFNLVFILAAFLALGLKCLELVDIHFTALLLAGTMSLAGLAQAGLLWYGAIRSAWALPFSALAGEQTEMGEKKTGQKSQPNSPVLLCARQAGQGKTVAGTDKDQSRSPCQAMSGQWGRVLPMALAWRILSRLPKGLAGAAAAQLFTLMAMILASAQGSGAVTALYFAERLVELPLGLVGVGLGLASMPTLSRLALSGQGEKFASCLADSLAMTLLLSLPASLGLAVIATWIVPLFFAHGAFDQRACDLTVLALLGYLPGLPGMALARGLLSGVSALGREASAAWSTLVCLVCLPMCHAILLACLPSGLAGMAPAMAASLAIWAHAGLLWCCINSHCGGTLLSYLAREHGKSLLSGLLSGLMAGLAAWLAVCLVPLSWQGWSGSRLEVAFMVFLAIAIAIPVWLVCLWLCKNRSLVLLLTSLKQKKRI